MTKLADHHGGYEWLIFLHFLGGGGIYTLLYVYYANMMENLYLSAQHQDERFFDEIFRPLGK